jgi:hypothetical protein
MLANNFAGAGEPFLIASDLLQGFRRVLFVAVARGFATRLHQPRAGQHGNVMGLEA